MRPGPKDWLWPIVCGFFMLAELAAVVLGHFRPPAIGLEAILFLLTLVGIFNLWEKLHFKRNENVPADVRALGGPVLVQRMSIFYGLGGLLVVCGSLALSGGAPEFRLLSSANAGVVEAAWVLWT